MPRQIHPIAEAYLYDSGAEGVLNRKRQGFYYSDWFYKSFPTYVAKGYVEQDPDPNKYKHRLTLVEEIQKLVLTPYPNAVTYDTSQWTSTGGSWQTTDELDFGSTRFMNLDASGAFAMMESNFTVNQGSSWSVVLRRATPKNSQDISTAFSYIEWDKWLLVLPYNDGPGLFKNVSGKWERVGDPLLSSNGQSTNDDGSNFIVVNYWNLDGKILLGGDWFRNNWVYQESEPIIVPDHKVAISHKGSSFQFNYYPTKFYQGMLNRTTEIPLFYATDGELEDTVEFDKIGASEPAGTSITVELDTVNTVDDETRSAVVYKMTMVPNGTGMFYQTPEIEAVGVKHKPELETYAVAYRNLAHPQWGSRLMSLNGEEGIDFDSNSWSLVLDNKDTKLGDPSILNTAEDVYLKPFKLMQLRVGHRLENNVRDIETVYTGAVITPVFGVYQNRKALANVRLANLSWLCQQVKAKNDWPVFDGWIIREALEWLALKCRVSTDRQIFVGLGEDITATGVNQQLSKGTPTNPLWQANLNDTSAWEMMKRMADYIKYDLYFDRVGNLICKPKPVPWLPGDPVDFTFYASELTLEDSEEYYNATDIEVSNQGEDWYNSLWIGGYKSGGGAIAAYRADWDSIYDPQSENYIGFEKGVSAAFDYIGSQEKCEELADIGFSSLLTYPRKMSFTTWLNKDVEPGKTFRMTNSEHPLVGTVAHPQVYRIISLSHNVSIDSLSTTSVVGEFLGEE